MLFKKFLLLLNISVLVTGCGSILSLDEVLPDNRTKYQKSQSLPNLEIPPDLSSDALNDPLTIPHEEDATTLSEFQRRKLRRQSEKLSDTKTTLQNSANEEWLVVQGTSSAIWSKLREFWIDKGFELDLDDAELGVMETHYREISIDGVITYREKFKIFSEEGDAPGKLILFLSGERQENISNNGGKADWIDQENNVVWDKDLVNELNAHFYGVTADLSSTSKQANSLRKPEIRAEVLDTEEGREYLIIPNEFSKAWKNIENAINESGMYIEKRDRETGIYVVMYYAVPTEDEKSLLSKLNFWDDGEEGEEFHIWLTGVGDKTEVVVLDNEDKWQENSDASRILSILQSRYNRLLGGTEQHQDSSEKL